MTKRELFFLALFPVAAAVVVAVVCAAEAVRAELDRWAL